MEKVDIAVIGETNNVVLFNAVGMKTFVLSDPLEIDKKIFELYKNGCKIIYVSEKIYVSITETLEKYATLAYPIILPLPINSSSTGVGEKKIKDSVEKAIGINIF